MQPLHLISSLKLDMKGVTRPISLCLMNCVSYTYTCSVSLLSNFNKHVTIGNIYKDWTIKIHQKKNKMIKHYMSFM